MKHKVFVASAGQSSEARENTQELMEFLTKHGHIITRDWTENWEEQDKENPADLALADIEGVRDCDALIYNWTGHDSFGAPYEMGYASGYTDGIKAMISYLLNNEHRPKEKRILMLYRESPPKQKIYLYMDNVKWCPTKQDLLENL